MKTIDRKPTKFVLADYESLIEDVNWKELEARIEEFNNSINIFQIPNKENIYRIDKNKVALLLENVDKVPSDLGDIDLSSMYNFLTINLPAISEQELGEMSMIKVFEEEDELMFEILKLPFQLENLNATIENYTEEIEDLEGMVKILLIQENELREQRSDRAKLKETLDFLILSQRKLKLKIKHLSTLILIQYSADISKKELLDQYRILEKKNEEIPVMLFAGLPSF